MTKHIEDVRDLFADFAFDISMIVLAAKSTEDATLKSVYLDKVIARTKELSAELLAMAPTSPFPLAA